jgi:hypothetical protein
MMATTYHTLISAFAITRSLMVPGTVANNAKKPSYQDRR